MRYRSEHFILKIKTGSYLINDPNRPNPLLNTI